jgi:hypothetical protein
VDYLLEDLQIVLLKLILIYAQFLSTGDAQDFGDLTAARYGLTSWTSNQLVEFLLADPPINTIDYITIASTGNAQDFGT